MRVQKAISSQRLCEAVPVGEGTVGEQMTVPKVSVIIPVYNTEKYLARCLDSVIGQTERDLEIICVNDGSTDGSAAILARYAATDPRIRVITQENGGLGPARNAGLETTTGDYVMFVDSDDFIPKDAIAKLMTAAREAKLPLVVSMAFAKTMPAVRDERVRWVAHSNEWIVGKKVEYSACNKLYAATLFKARRFAPIYHEDYPVIVGVFCEVRDFAAVAEPMYVYCDNGVSSIIRSPYSEKKLRDKLFGVRAILEISSPYAGTIPFRQAVKGVATVIGKVTKAKKLALTKVLATELQELFRNYPELRKQLPFRARFRWWKLKRKLQHA